MGTDEGDGNGGSGPAGVPLDEYVLQRRLPSADVDGADVWLARERDGIGEVLVHVVALPNSARASDDFVATAQACVQAKGPQLASGREVIVGEHALAMVWNVPSGRPWADGAGSPLELERGRGLAERLGWLLADPSAGGAWVTDSGRVLVVPTPRRVTEAAEPTTPASSEPETATTDRSGSPRHLMRAQRMPRRPGLDVSALRRAALLATVLVVAVVLGLASVRVWQDEPQQTAQVVGSEPSSPVSGVEPGVSDQVPEPDWKAVVERLDASRSAAYAAADPSAVSSFAVPGSPAAEQDLAVLGDLVAQGLRADGYAPVIEQIEPLTTDTGRVVIAVTDSVSAYRWVDGQGTVVREMPSRRSTQWRLELRENNEVWRIWAVSAAT